MIMKKVTKILMALTMVFAFTMVALSKNGTRSQEPKIINVVGTGITREIDCTGNENIVVKGSNIKVVVKGGCNEINIAGSSVIVTAEAVKVIKIEGVDCGVRYKSSPTKNGKAVSSVIGVGSYVTKIK